MARRSRTNDDESSTADDGDSPTRTERKHASDELQSLGDRLVDVPDDVLAGLPVSETLRDAVADARRMPSFGARRRQSQFIGKLMRRLDADDLSTVRAAVAAASAPTAVQTAQLHRAERWRDELIADDDAFGRWLERHPDTDAQQLRALIRQARKDAVAPHPGAAPRRGRAYREIFALVRETLARTAADP
jgi:ribosome-associated protein